MNLALLPQIAALLGNPNALGQGGGNLPNTGQSPDAPPDIPVSGNAIPPERRRSGLLGGGFSAGRTGGNILGILGDALLTASGRDPVYAGRLQNARQADALQNYSTDPLLALQKLTMVDGSKVLPAFNQYYDNQRADKTLDANLKYKDADYEDSGRSALGAMLYSANEKTFPAVLARAKAFAERRGIDVSDLPQSWDEAKGWATGTVSVDKQVSSEDMRNYRTIEEARRAAADANRNNYYNARVGETGRHNKTMEGIATTNATTRSTSVAKAPDRSKWTQPQPKGKGAVAPGEAKKPVWDAAKQKYVMQ